MELTHWLDVRYPPPGLLSDVAVVRLWQQKLAVISCERNSSIYCYL